MAAHPSSSLFFVSSAASSSSSSSSSSLFLLLFLWSTMLMMTVPTTVTALRAAVGRECRWDIQCEELYKPGSKCLDDGRCSNPFAAGCLYNHRRLASVIGDVLPPKRVCNSNDHNNNDDDDVCERGMNYTEVRVHNGDWESPMFYAWIIQIFLSEFLQVPVTVGMNADDTPIASFYNPTSGMSWSSQAYAFEHLLTANANGGRCDDLATTTTTTTNSATTSTSTTSTAGAAAAAGGNCIHVMPEVWIGQEKKWKDYLSQGHIDQVNGGGLVGKISWYIPTLTAQRYPQVASFHGMANRREELAAIFDRPITWKDYCDTVSSDGCATPNDVAQRPPEEGGGQEDDQYFLQGVYTGHFRPTDQNNCTANPDTCSGHIVGAPCSWSTNIDAQAYHNDIALESNGPLIENGGYSYGQMIQIWRAANATQSDIVMWWWTPDATVEEFRDTPYQFQPVLLPEPTSECRQARIVPADRCSMDPDIRRGNPGGGCDNEANSLQTVVASSLRELTFATPEVDRSPGYQAILNLKVNHLDMNTMLQEWVAGGRTGYAARNAVCQYVIDHEDELESYIPRGYPRVFQDDTSYQVPLLYAAISVASFAIAYVLVIAVLVYHFSSTKVFVYAQVPFIFMVLLGLLLVAIASLLFALTPEDGICTSQIWLLTVGYTLELVPLLVKVAAINRLMAATKRMRRVRISMQSLFCTVATLVLLVVVYLTIWTILDPPQRQEGRYLNTEQDDNTATTTTTTTTAATTNADEFLEIVTTVTCDSDSQAWELIVLCWNGLLIVCATVLAFQSRTIKQEFNDSRSLGTMIYSHFVFGVLRAVTFNLNGGGSSSNGGSGGSPTIESSTLAAASSFLMSLDAITAVTIYFVPKLEAARKAPQPHASLTSDDNNAPTTFTPPDAGDPAKANMGRHRHRHRHRHRSGDDDDDDNDDGGGGGGSHTASRYGTQRSRGRNIYPSQLLAMNMSSSSSSMRSNISTPNELLGTTTASRSSSNGRGSQKTARKWSRSIGSMPSIVEAIDDERSSSRSLTGSSSSNNNSNSNNNNVDVIGNANNSNNSIGSNNGNGNGNGNRIGMGMTRSDEHRRRIGMDGSMVRDPSDQGEESESSDGDEEDGKDWGGPRFAASKVTTLSSSDCQNSNSNSSSHNSNSNTTASNNSGNSANSRSLFSWGRGKAAATPPPPPPPPHPWTQAVVAPHSSILSIHSDMDPIEGGANANSKKAFESAEMVLPKQEENSVPVGTPSESSTHRDGILRVS